MHAFLFTDWPLTFKFDQSEPVTGQDFLFSDWPVCSSELLTGKAFLFSDWPLNFKTSEPGRGHDFLFSDWTIRFRLLFSDWFLTSNRSQDTSEILVSDWTLKSVTGQGFLFSDWLEVSSFLPLSDWIALVNVKYLLSDWMTKSKEVDSVRQGFCDWTVLFKAVSNERGESELVAGQDFLFSLEEPLNVCERLIILDLSVLIGPESDLEAVLDKHDFSDSLKAGSRSEFVFLESLEEAGLSEKERRILVFDWTVRSNDKTNESEFELERCVFSDWTLELEGGVRNSKPGKGSSLVDFSGFLGVVCNCKTVTELPVAFSDL